MKDGGNKHASHHIHVGTVLTACPLDPIDGEKEKKAHSAECKRAGERQGQVKNGRCFLLIETREHDKVAVDSSTSNAKVNSTTT